MEVCAMSEHAPGNLVQLLSKHLPSTSQKRPVLFVFQYGIMKAITIEQCFGDWILTKSNHADILIMEKIKKHIIVLQRM